MNIFEVNDFLKLKYTISVYPFSQMSKSLNKHSRAAEALNTFSRGVKNYFPPPLVITSKYRLITSYA